MSRPATPFEPNTATTSVTWPDEGLLLVGVAPCLVDLGA
jgi:hypothetical protein